MDLMLIREYWPGGTNGRLYCQGELLSLTFELPADHFRLHSPCIPEGKYCLVLDQHSNSQALLLLSLGKKEFLARITVELESEKEMPNIVLAAAITGEGRGQPDPRAFRLLRSRVGQLLGKGEKALLEIRSYPEQALNLTYHQIAWMD